LFLLERLKQDAPYCCCSGYCCSYFHCSNWKSNYCCHYLSLNSL